MFINRALKHFLFVFLLSILSFSSYVSGEGRCSASFSTLTGHIRVASGVAAGFGRDVVTNLRTRTEEARNQMTTEAEAEEVAAKDEAQEGATEAGTPNRRQLLSNQARITANVALGLGRDAVASTRARAAASRNQITAERAEAAAEGLEASSPNIRERLRNQGRVVSDMVQGVGRDAVVNTRTRAQNIRQQRAARRATATEVEVKPEENADQASSSEVASESAAATEQAQSPNGVMARGVRAVSHAARSAVATGRDAAGNIQARVQESSHRIGEGRAAQTNEGAEVVSPTRTERLGTQAHIVSDVALGLGRDGFTSARTRVRDIRQQRAEERRLGIPARVWNILKKEANIYTREDLLGKTEEDLLSIKGIGNRTVDHIKKELAERGFSLSLESSAQTQSSRIRGQVRAVSNATRSAVATGRDAAGNIQARVQESSHRIAEGRAAQTDEGAEISTPTRAQRLGTQARIASDVALGLGRDGFTSARTRVQNIRQQRAASRAAAAREDEISTATETEVKPEENADQASSSEVAATEQAQSPSSGVMTRGVRAVSNATRSAVATGRDAAGNIQARVQESSHRIGEGRAAQTDEGAEAVPPTRAQRLGTQARIASDVALGLGRDGFTSARTRVQDIRQQRAASRAEAAREDETSTATEAEVKPEENADQASSSEVAAEQAQSPSSGVMTRGVRAVSNATRSAVATGRDAVSNIQTRVQESSHRIAEGRAAQTDEGAEISTSTRAQRLGTQARIASDVALGLGRDGFTSARTRVQDIRQERAARRAAATEENETSTTVKPEEATAQEATAEAGRVVADQEESS